MKIQISNKLILTDVPDLYQEIIAELTIINPKYLEAEKQGRWLGNLERQLFFYDEAGVLSTPRGFAYKLVDLCREHNIKPVYDDCRRVLPEVNFQFNGSLRPYQVEAVNDVLKKDFGVLDAPTGSGKTCMALAIVAMRKQPTLIIVHTKELLNQWVDRIQQFLGIPKNEIGIIGSGKMRIGKITVSMVQSLYKCADEVKNHVGFVICDECHRIPSRTFSEAITAFDCRYMLGLSATVFRRDGLSKLIGWFVGDIVHTVNREELVGNGSITSFEVITRETNFNTKLDASIYYSKVISELCLDDERNNLIAKDVVKIASDGQGVALILSDRKEHCLALHELIKRHGIDVALLTGDMSSKARQTVVERISSGAVPAVVATLQLIGEGFDSAALSTLLLATPVKFSGRLIQAIGRILRPADGKRAVVFDYVDSNVGVLKASGQSRAKVYAGLQGCSLHP